MRGIWAFLRRGSVTNSKYKGCILPFFQKIAISTPVFCYFAFRKAQIAILTPIFAIFPKISNSRLCFLPSCNRARGSVSLSAPAHMPIPAACTPLLIHYPNTQFPAGEACDVEEAGDRDVVLLNHRLRFSSTNNCKTQTFQGFGSVIKILYICYTFII